MEEGGGGSGGGCSKRTDGCSSAFLAHRIVIYKMNFPRKNPMKMAAMTTSSEGRELALCCLLIMPPEFDTMLSGRRAFRCLRPSSCTKHKPQF